MNKKGCKSSLGLELGFITICALAAAMLLFVSLRTVAYNQLDEILWKPETITKQEEKYIRELQQYVTENLLKKNDKDALDRWTQKNSFFLLTLYDDGTYIYSSNHQAIVPLEEEVYWDTETDSYQNNYQITFSDGEVKAVLIYLFEAYYYYSITDALCALVAFLVFMVILFWFIQRKMSYIFLLESELKILGGGDLNYTITVQGKDELASLAAEIDSMRKAVLERQEIEDAAMKANRDLVTAMSHDLRTPLTALMGYMDILNLELTNLKPEQKKYMKAARSKAYQIKSISDKLFEYFIVYGKGQDEVKMQAVNGAEFVGQFVEESLFDMESNDFQVERMIGEVNCQVEIDVDSMQRVFGNVFSNLLKYADKNYPVCVEYKQENGWLLIQFQNHVAPKVSVKESNHIGLKTCERIVENHKGKFFFEKKEPVFLLILAFPIFSNNE